MVRHHTKHGLPAVLSLIIPGLGQLIKGHVIKGILIFIFMAISSALMWVVIGFITTPILYLWNVYDAYNSN